MIEYHLKYYHTHSRSEHNINYFSFGDLYRFLHLSYIYVKHQENKTYEVLEKLPKYLMYYDYIHSNRKPFLSSKEIDKIAVLDYDKEIRFKKEKFLMEFCVYRIPKRMIGYYTFDNMQLNDHETCEGIREELNYQERNIIR